MDLTGVLKYIDDYWPRMVRENPTDNGTLLGLPRPYMIPRDQDDRNMFQEMYYWDTYFMALGLVGTQHEQLILDTAENMGHLIDRFGFIPNGSRTYLTGRSQPPFFTSVIWLAYEVKVRRGDPDVQDYLRQMMLRAVREHETAWLGKDQPHHRQVHHGLSRYFDVNYLPILASCESGWDHTTRCESSEKWLDYLPVDLNSILYVRELDFARAAEVMGVPDDVARWQSRAEDRYSEIQRLMWDESEGFYFDYNYVTLHRNLHLSLAGFYPMWARIATPQQARRMVETWLPKFLYPGGLVTTLEKRHDRQWAFPNGWAPLQWLVANGLDHYGYHAEARDVRQRWVDNCVRMFEQTHALWEKYNVVDVGGDPEVGMYGQLKGFGWTNSILLDFLKRLSESPPPAPVTEEVAATAG